MSAFSAYSSSFRALAAKSSNQAAKLSKTGSWILRQDEWMQQSRAAALEINQLKRQMLAAEIRTEIAQKEIDNHEQQILNAREVLDFITGDESVVKFTSNATLYNWMAGQLILLHRQAYKMAHDLARQAERCYRHEMGLTDSHFIKSDYWDDDHKGLLAGDRLSNALKQMEKDYLDKNERDFEITKHISLNQLDPLALLNLREGGTCKFAIPEDLFDLDFPGHYFRRIKSVSISIPCVAGPYTSVNATLRLEENLTRISVEELATDDQRFRRGFNGIKSIATSSGQNDSGMFELNFRDERYLPFEGAGAISTWSLEMMEDKNLRQFDYDTIADVIVHLRYTAREDDNWKSTVLDHSTGIINKLRGATLSRLFSLRHDFPNEWHRWTKGTDETLRVRLEKRYFPYFVQAWDLKFSQAELHPVLSDITPTPAGIFENNDELTVSNLPKTVRDCYVIVHYSISPPDGSDDEGSGGDITGPGGDPPGGPDPPGGSTLILPAAALRLRATENVPNTTGTGARFRLNLPATLPDPANLLVFATAEFDAAAPSQYNKANFVTWANNAWWLNTPDTTTALTAHVAAVPLSGTTIAFRHIATASTLYEPDSNTISEKYATSLDHPALNDHPAAILFVTSVRGNNGAGETDKDRHVAVWYDPEKKKWAVVFPSQYGIPVGTQFNVLIGNGSNAFRHTVTAGSVHRDWASVSLLPPAVGQDKVVLLTEYWPFSQLVTGTQNVLTEVNKALFNLQWFPEYSRWGVFALVHAPAKVGMQFNVWVL